MKDWSKKRYWIVGASEGLGLALAQKMSEAGVSLILTARNKARLKEIALTLPNEAEVLPLDITCLLYTSPSPRDAHESRMPSSA